jgi:pimeloyl-ACP methyl ester carboxylesterase
LDIDAAPAEQLIPCGLLDKVSILGPFWKIDAYDGLINTLKNIGYRDRGSQSLFVFTYDWRQSNVDSARQLNQFIEQINAPKVDIVAHSMGGLVSAIYAHNYDGAKRINKIVFLGTPFMGSMNTFATLSDGWGGFQNIIVGGIESIRRTALSFAALYELLPRYPNCCRMGTQNNYVPVDPMNASSWRQYHWLPGEYDSGGRAGHFDSRLAGARAVQEIMQRPLPNGIASVKVVGDVFGTNLYLLGSNSDPSWKGWTFVKARGDETVPAWSAANNTESLEGTNPSFSTHGTIFNDRTVQSILERELLNVSIPKEVRTRALPISSNVLKPFDFIDISLEPGAVPVNGQANVFLNIHWVTATTRGEYKPRGFLRGPGQDKEITFSETTSDVDLAANTLTFVGGIDAPSEAGQWRIQFDFGDFDADYLAYLTTYLP